MKSYRNILYLIGTTILVTLAIQVYWNVQNYQLNKQRLVNDVQIALDNSVESYYADLAKKNVFIYVPTTNVDSLQFQFDFDYPKKKRDSVIKTFVRTFDSIPRKMQKNSPKSVSLSYSYETSTSKQLKIRDSFEVKGKGEKAAGWSVLVNTMAIALTSDSIRFPKLDSILKIEFNRKNISLDYGLKYYNINGDTILYNLQKAEKKELGTFSKSSLLKQNERIELLFSNPTILILKRSLTGIGLSLLLALGTVASLLYLLHIINKQKQLAEIKNDLISNITHEFKTPIATVSTALEAIQNFNVKNDAEKTKKYLDISNQQLKKLHQMVEKLLETATLDSDRLFINKEETNLVLLIKALVEKYKVVAADKTIHFKHADAEIIKMVDPFHFENAIANLLDNAVKYGGNTIEVQLSQVLGQIEITVADNGPGIEKSQREKIFDKFYRIPTGNVHNVKGFGIGLYYVKKIIEKHGGTITLTDAKNTVFKITI